MTDNLTDDIRSNKPVLGRSADGMSDLTAQLAVDLQRRNRKVNAAGHAQPKSTTPWYRRFDRR